MGLEQRAGEGTGEGTSAAVDIAEADLPEAEEPCSDPRQEPLLLMQRLSNELSPGSLGIEWSLPPFQHPAHDQDRSETCWQPVGTNEHCHLPEVEAVFQAQQTTRRLWVWNYTILFVGLSSTGLGIAGLNDPDLDFSGEPNLYSSKAVLIAGTVTIVCACTLFYIKDTFALMHDFIRWSNEVLLLFFVLQNIW